MSSAASFAASLATAAALAAASDATRCSRGPTGPLAAPGGSLRQWRWRWRAVVMAMVMAAATALAAAAMAAAAAMMATAMAAATRAVAAVPVPQRDACSQHAIGQLRDRGRRRGGGERVRFRPTFAVRVSTPPEPAYGVVPTRRVGYLYSASSPGGLGRFPAEFHPRREGPRTDARDL